MSEEHVRAFQARLEEAGGTVHRVGDEVAAARVVDEICARAGVASPAGSASPAAGATSLAEFEQAPVGLTGADFAIAETGTIGIVMEGDAALAARLPPVHIVLLAADAILPDLDAAVPVMRGLIATRGAPGSYIDWITGPSRSADIEQSLTIGIHGPRELHCILIDDPAAVS